jgi:steroid delta-isomerase-like uncharacterized protein
MTTNTMHLPLIAEQWRDAWNAKNPDAMRALFCADGKYQDFAFKISAEGASRVGAWIQISIDHIPDLRVEILNAFQAGDQVSVEWTFSGTPLMLGPAAGTGKRFSVTVFSILELAGGKIVRAADCYNLADVLQQLDIVHPSLPGPAWRTL